MAGRPWMKAYGSATEILSRPGIGIATSYACCCGGCCEGILIPTTIDPITLLPVYGTVLVATVIADTSGCIPVGTAVDMDDWASPNIWESVACLFTPWDSLLLSCVQQIGQPIRLVLQWKQLCGCPTVDTSGGGLGWQWTALGGSCTPFQWDFQYTFAEVAPPSICPCLTGTVTVRITIKP